MQSLTHEQCYQALNADINISWDELRKTYRVLIQKWHPDRFKEESEKELATNKLKEINIAYTQLTKHYRKHGELPIPVVARRAPIYSENVQQKKSTESSPIQDSVNRSTKTTYSFNQTKTDKKKGVFFTKRTTAFILVLIPIGLIFIYQPSDPVNTTIHIPEETPIESVTPNKSNSKFKLSYHTEDIKPEEGVFFTYGSTIGKVILTQGAPERTQGNIWYYGKSEVHFAKGKVVKWVRNANNPLKARAIPKY